MPRLSVWSLRSALFYLAIGFTFGALLLIHKGFPIFPWSWSLLPAHIEFLLVGWVMQLVLGVAFWILPRFRQEPKRGNETIAWLAWVFLNIGIWFAGLGVFVPAYPWLPLAGHLFEAAAAVAFALHAWPRVRPTRG